jgi:CRP-like cAMP-binding protein
MTAVFASSSPRTALLRALFHGPGRSINSGATIFQRGDPSRSLYFLATGVVKLTDVSPVGDEIIIRLIQPGDIFGERCFMGGAQQHWATSLEPSTVMERSVDGVIEEVRTRPGTLVDLLRELSVRVAATDEAFQASITETVVVRLGSRLLALAESPHTTTDWLDVPQGFGHQQLAQMIGVQRETITRAIGNLRRLGLIATAGRGPIRIHRPAMRRFVGKVLRSAWTT